MCVIAVLVLRWAYLVLAEQQPSTPTKTSALSRLIVVCSVNIVLYSSALVFVGLLMSLYPISTDRSPSGRTRVVCRMVRVFGQASIAELVASVEVVTGRLYSYMAD